MCDQFIHEIEQLEIQKEKALYLKATNLVKLKHNEEAMKVLDVLESMANGSKHIPCERKSDYHYLRGCVYADTNNHKSAILQFTKALELNPHQYKAAYARATSYNFIGDFDKAIKDYEMGMCNDSKEQ